MSPSTVELMIGYVCSASAAARAKNGRKDSLSPVFAWKSFFTRSRYCDSLVTSTSTTVVSCAVDCIDATARSASTLRRRDIGCVVPRRGDTSTSTGAASAADVGAAGASAAFRTSSLRMRPPTPVPVTLARSTPCCCARRRTRGVT